MQSPPNHPHLPPLQLVPTLTPTSSTPPPLPPRPRSTSLVPPATPPRTILSAPSTPELAVTAPIHSEDEHLEHLAEEIARQGASLDPRARDRDVQDGTTEETETQRALEELEDVEVALFLARVGDALQDVRIPAPSHAIPFPELSAFRKDGKTDWSGFAEAYATTAAAVYTPPSLLARPKRTSFSVTVARNHVERLYVICPPQVWEKVLRGNFARIWRWESPSTWKWCTLYVVLWIFDLIPMFPPLAFLAMLLRARWFPPSPAERLAQSKDRSLRAAHATELSKQLKTSNRFSFAFEGAKNLVQDLTKSSSSSQPGVLARGLGGSATLAGMAGGLKIVDEVEKSKTTRTTKSKSSAEGEDVSVYRLASDLTEVFGPPIQEGMGQVSDIAEKIKNLILHPDHPSVIPVCYRLGAISLFLLFCPTWITIKSTWAYLGLEFFVLFRLREQYPEYRRALLPIWWVLLGAPTDADYATWIIQRRSQQNKPLRGSKTIKRLSRNKGDASKLSISNGLSSAVAFGLGTNSRASSIAEGLGDPLGSYFSMLNSTPGTLRLYQHRIRFEPIRGFRTFGLKQLNKKLIHSSILTPDDASDSSGRSSHDDKNLLVDLRADDIVSARKGSTLGFDSIEIGSQDGTVWKLSNVSSRDDCFNKVLSIAPSSLRAS